MHAGITFRTMHEFNSIKFIPLYFCGLPASTVPPGVAKNSTCFVLQHSEKEENDIFRIAFVFRFEIKPFSKLPSVCVFYISVFYIVSYSSCSALPFHITFPCHFLYLTTLFSIFFVPFLLPPFSILFYIFSMSFY